MNDVELMLAMKSGDEVCLEQLMSKHRHAVTHFIFRHVQDSAVAEELAQDVFLNIYRTRDRYEPSAKFTTWLYTIAKNRSMNWVRDNRHFRQSRPLDHVVLRKPAASATPEQQMMRQAMHARVRTAVSELPERQRRAVLLHKFSEMEYLEIAEDFECSLTAVKALLNRAYTSLRKSLDAEKFMQLL